MEEERKKNLRQLSGLKLSAYVCVYLFFFVFIEKEDFRTGLRCKGESGGN